MKRWAGATFLLFTLSSPLANDLRSHFNSDVIFHHLSQTQWYVVAFKSGTSIRPANVCGLGRCLPLLNKWQLFVWPTSYTGQRSLLIQEKGSWSFKGFYEDRSLFERTLPHLIKLRVPASVIKEIEKEGEEVFVNRKKDGELYKVITKHPWGTRWRLPVDSNVTSAFGSPRIPPSGLAYSHSGVDLHAPNGTVVRACSDGIVLDEDNDPIYGNVITIDHGQGLLSRYMHLSKFVIKVGESVKGGDVIALSGSTGRSEAPHLHWEMRFKGMALDPLETSRLLEHLSYLE